METTQAKSSQKKKEYAIEQFDLNGAGKGEMAFSKTLLSTDAPQALTAQYVRVYLTNQRQGTAKAKGRAEVAGTTKKVYKQKGTGKARHGSMRAPIFKGGGVVGGPLPKEYSLSINKKQKRQVLYSALRTRIMEGAVVGLAAEMEDSKPKTKTVAAFLKKMKMEGKKVLFVLPLKRMEKFVLSIRNISKTSYVPATNLNSYELLSAGKIVFVNNALEELEKHLNA